MRPRRWEAFGGCGGGVLGRERTSPARLNAPLPPLPPPPLPSQVYEAAKLLKLQGMPFTITTPSFTKIVRPNQPPLMERKEKKEKTAKQPPKAGLVAVPAALPEFGAPSALSTDGDEGSEEARGSSEPMFAAPRLLVAWPASSGSGSSGDQSSGGPAPPLLGSMSALTAGSSGGLSGPAGGSDSQFTV